MLAYIEFVRHININNKKSKAMIDINFWGKLIIVNKRAFAEQIRK
jgi:hypothetical protein